MTPGYWGDPASAGQLAELVEDGGGGEADGGGEFVYAGAPSLAVGQVAQRGEELPMVWGE